MSACVCVCVYVELEGGSADSWSGGYVIGSVACETKPPVSFVPFFPLVKKKTVCVSVSASAPGAVCVVCGWGDG